MEKKYDESHLIEVLVKMVGYAMNCSNGEKRSYLKDLANTGLFHDAIGKVLEMKDGNVLVTEEY